MNKKKVIGYILGGIGGYIFSHYVISPYFFGSNADKVQEQITIALDEELNHSRRKLPLRIDKYSTLIAIDRRELSVAYTYELNAAQIQNSPLMNYSTQRHKENLCASVAHTFEHNIHYDFIYKDTNNQILQTIPIDKKLCRI